MHRRQLLTTLASLALAPEGSPAAAPLRVELVLSEAKRRVAAYDRIDARVVLSGGAAPYRNPFDPDEIAIDAILSGPGGRRIALPGFFSRDYTELPGDGRSIPVLESATGFRVRIAADRPGAWTLTVTARDRSGTANSAAIPLTVGPATSPGFLVRTPGCARYFAHTDGSAAFLIGENVCWAGKGGLDDYRTWLPKLAGAGGNFARLWMTYHPLESTESGLGRYDMASAGHFDGILALAQRHSIACMLAFMTYGELATGGYFNEGRWSISPYNAKNGGPVPAERPDDFFTNPEARRLYKRRLRYLVARYAAFRSLGFWEFWNEKDAPAAWLDEMARFVRSLDPYRHPITNSYSTTGPDASWKLSSLDLTQTHRYGDEGSLLDIAPLAWADTRAHDRFGKPHLLGEFGISWRGHDGTFDPKGLATNFHNGLWAGALSGAAGTSMLWWWDSYVEPKNLYGTLTGVAAFARAIPWNRRDFQPLALPPVTRPETAPETFSDLVLTPDGGWGTKTNGTATIGRDGSVHGAPLLTHLYGPAKAELRSVQRLDVTLDRPATLILRVLTVSVRAQLVVHIDGVRAAMFGFDATPGKDNFVETKAFPEYGGIYQALFNADRTVEIPAGRHTITLENTEGDWLNLGALTLTGTRSSRYARLRTMALQDAATADTLIWLQDPESHWKNDADGWTPTRWAGVALTVPVPRVGAYTARFVDTRTGKLVGTGRGRGTTLRFTLPSFTRDIAVRITRDM
jgi:hypothetical protein